MEFKCPHCGNTGEEQEHNSYGRGERLGEPIAFRILNFDQMNGQEKEHDKVELWECCDCRKFFTIYFKISQISKLIESNDTC